MKIKKNIESMSKNMESNGKLNKEDEELRPSSVTAFQSEKIGPNKHLIE